jgi:uncharacterized membrane-anchored protein
MSANPAVTRPAPLRVPSRKRLLLGVVAAFLIQAGLLGAMLIDRAMLLSRGAEIRLPVVPVDPRDFLRGDYVILSYPISQIRSDRIGGRARHSRPTRRSMSPWRPRAGSWRLDRVLRSPAQIRPVS